jgi:hypothetical protein
MTLCAAALVGGCVNEKVTTSDGRPMSEKPRQAPVTPSDAVINRMAFMVGSKPDDTTGNGYPDLIRATVALFASPHPMAVRGNGVFEFRLYTFGSAARPDAEPLAFWRIEGEDITKAEAMGSYGPAYQFQLSLNDAGGDQYPLTSADLRCRFIPADGSPPVQSDGVRSIRIGRR